MDAEEKNEIEELELFDKKRDYSTRHISSVLKKLAGRLEGNDKAWVEKACDRLDLLRCRNQYRETEEKGNSFSSEVTFDIGYESTFFTVGKSLENALKYAEKKFKEDGGRIKRIEIKREDKIRYVEPGYENDRNG